MKSRFSFPFLATLIIIAPLALPVDARAECAVIDPPAEVRVTTDNDFFSNKPQIGWTDAATFGITWMEGNYDDPTKLYYNTVDDTGQVGPADLQISDNEAQVTVLSSVWTGSQFGTCWHDNRNGDFEIYFTRYDAAGTPAGADVRVTDSAGFSWYPRIEWNGTDFGVLFQDNRDGQADIYFTAVDSSGNKLFLERKITNTVDVCTVPDLSWDGSDYGLVWEDHRGANPQIYFAKIDVAGNQVVAPKQIVESPAGSYKPRIAA